MFTQKIYFKCWKPWGESECDYTDWRSSNKTSYLKKIVGNEGNWAEGRMYGVREKTVGHFYLRTFTFKYIHILIHTYILSHIHTHIHIYIPQRKTIRTTFMIVGLNL